MSLQNTKEFIHVVARYQPKTDSVRVAVFHDHGGTPAQAEDTLEMWQNFAKFLTTQGVPFTTHNMPKQEAH